MSHPIRLKAMEIVEAEEHAKGWSPHVVGVAALEKEHGCDLVSTAPTGEKHFVEAKDGPGHFSALKGSSAIRRTFAPAR